MKRSSSLITCWLALLLAVVLPACQAGTGRQTVAPTRTTTTTATPRAEASAPASTAAPTVAPVTPATAVKSLSLAFVRNGSVWYWRDGQEQLLFDDGSAAEVRVSDDGRLVAFSRLRETTLSDGSARPEPLELWAVETAGGEARRLLGQRHLAALGSEEEQVGLHHFDWVPGSHSLLFNTAPVLTYRQPSDDLHRLDVDEGRWTTLLDSGAGGNFRPSPDGRAAAVVSETEIQVVDLDSGEARLLLSFPLVTPPGCCRFYPEPVWAPDARSLTMLIPPPEPGESSAASVWRLPVDGSPANVVSEVPLNFRFWSLPGLISPDTAWIAYPQLTATGANQLRVTRLDGTVTYDVTGLPDGTISSIQWAPDAAQLVVGMRKGQPPLHLVRVGNDQTRPVADALLEEVTWISPTHFLYHTGRQEDPVLSLGASGAQGQALVSAEEDLQAPTRFIEYDPVR